MTEEQSRTAFVQRVIARLAMRVGEESPAGLGAEVEQLDAWGDICSADRALTDAGEQFVRGEIERDAVFEFGNEYLEAWRRAALEFIGAKGVATI